MRITPYNQLSSDVSFTPSSVNLDYPIENIYDTYGSIVFKFTGYADENIVINKTDYFDFNSIGIYNHNLTSGATITLQANTSDSWGSPPYSVTLTWRDELVYDFVTAVAAASNYDYVRIRFQDSGNTEPIQIGYIMLGDYVQMPGFTSDVNIIVETVETAYITGSGQAGGEKKYDFRQITINMADFSNTQRQTISDIITTNGASVPVVGVLWESDFTKELPLFAVMEPTKSFTQNDNQMNNFATSFTLRETL